MEMWSIALPRRIRIGENSFNKFLNSLELRNTDYVYFLIDENVLKSGIERVVKEKKKKSNNFIVITYSAGEPTDKKIKEIILKMSNPMPSLIVAIGGGSCIDTAKILSVVLPNQIKEYEIFNLSNYKAEKRIQLVAVPTTAGTGAEVTPNAIVINSATSQKIGIVNSSFVPEEVILDPVLTLSLPPFVTAMTGIDAFAHAMESYFSQKNNFINETIALTAMKLIIENIQKVVNYGDNLNSREKMLLGAFYGGLCIAISGTGLAHAMAYPLGGRYGIPHGVAVAILLPAVVRFNGSVCLERVKNVCKILGVEEKDSDISILLYQIEARLKNLIRKIGLPLSLKEYGVSEITANEIEEMSEEVLAIERLVLNNIREVTKEDVKNIYKELLIENGK